jgi:type II secretory pathway component PulJ
MLELAVTVLIMSVVLGALYPSLDSFVRHTTQTEKKAQVLADTRRAVETIARDLRAANPIDALPTLTEYDNRVRFSVFCSTPGVNDCSSARLRQVEYRRVGHQLQRIVNGGTPRVILGPSGPAGRPEAEQFGAVVNTGPVFRFFKKTGQQLTTSGATAPPSSVQFRDCAKSVEIDLLVRSARTGGTTTSLLTQVDLRNWNEVTGC